MSIPYQIALPADPSVRRIGPAVIRFLSMWWATYTVWRNRQLVIAALQRLDDRLLQDIGIGRDEIESAVRTGRCRRIARA